MIRAITDTLGPLGTILAVIAGLAAWGGLVWIACQTLAMTGIEEDDE
jgi:hypothetical protein